MVEIALRNYNISKMVRRQCKNYKVILHNTVRLYLCGVALCYNQTILNFLSCYAVQFGINLII